MKGPGLERSEIRKVRGVTKGPATKDPEEMRIHLVRIRTCWIQMVVAEKIVYWTDSCDKFFKSILKKEKNRTDFLAAVKNSGVCQTNIHFLLK